MFVVVIVYLFIKIFIFVLSGSDCFGFGLMTTQRALFAFYGSYLVFVVAVVVVSFLTTQESRIRNSLN